MKLASIRIAALLALVATVFLSHKGYTSHCEYIVHCPETTCATLRAQCLARNPPGNYTEAFVGKCCYGTTGSGSYGRLVCRDKLTGGVVIDQYCRLSP